MALRDKLRIKLVTLGVFGSGKSTALTRWKTGIFHCASEPTIGTDFSVKTSETGDAFELWDTAGQERHDAVTKSYVRDALIALIVFDASNRRPVDWDREVRHYIDMVDTTRLCKGIVYLLGTKSDLDSGESPLTIPKDVLRRVDGFTIISAKTGQGCEAAWAAMTRILWGKPEVLKHAPLSITPPVYHAPPGNEHRCCVIS